MNSLISAQLSSLEKIIEDGLQSFQDVGKALATIQKDKLYHETHKTFKAYCKDRWKLSAATAYRRIQSQKPQTKNTELLEVSPNEPLSAILKTSHSETLLEAPLTPKTNQHAQQIAKLEAQIQHLTSLLRTIRDKGFVIQTRPYTIHHNAEFFDQCHLAIDGKLPTDPF